MGGRWGQEVCARCLPTRDGCVVVLEVSCGPLRAGDVWGGAVGWLNACVVGLLAMFDEVVVSQEWYCKWNVRLGRSQVAVLECFVDVVEGSTATWLFKIGSHTSDGIHFKVCMTPTAELFGCFK